MFTNVKLTCRHCGHERHLSELDGSVLPGEVITKMTQLTCEHCHKTGAFITLSMERPNTGAPAGSSAYELVAYWEVPREDLPRAELTALHAMKAAFGASCDEREAFYVDAVEHAYAVVAASIASYATHEARGNVTINCPAHCGVSWQPTRCHLHIESRSFQASRLVSASDWDCERVRCNTATRRWRQEYVCSGKCEAAVYARNAGKQIFQKSLF